jgi:YidC/Oxa1 family membrane protein insertase
MQPKRLIIALILSTAILFAWNYLFPIKPPQQGKTDETSTKPQITPTPASSSEGQKAASEQRGPAGLSDTVVAQRTVVIKTALYEAKLDTRGAAVVSWIIKKNKDSGRPIHSVASTRNSPVPLELVPQEALKREELPMQLVTGDTALDAVLSSRNYSLEGLEAGGGTIELNLSENEQRKVTFRLQDAGTGLDVTKTLVFNADNYSTDLEITLKRGDQIIPQGKIKIGPSIGDQGIKHYSFYSVAPEAIANVGGRVERHAAASINENKKSPDHLALNGPVDWAGVGDTYFAMVAVPSKRMEGLEYHTTAYQAPNSSKPEKRYLITAFVPVPTDGSRTIVYVGPKDHYLLTDASKEIAATVGRNIDLEGLIDYGWLGWVSRPLAVPILWSIKKLYHLTNSYGIAIILFTVVIYSLFFPLKWRSSRAMKKAQKLAPRMKEIQEKIKGMKQSDPRLKELQVEQLRLMKEGNPLGGCLPLLIQMPFLFALYRAITISLDFRQASFLWLPDLSAGDPYHILEIMMAGTMIILQLITPAPSADPLQRKMMAIGMPLFMLYVLWGAPSGLLVYWLVGNIVGFSQQFLINRWTKSEDDEEPPPAEPRAQSRPRKKLSEPRVSQA